MSKELVLFRIQPLWSNLILSKTKLSPEIYFKKQIPAEN